MEIKVTIGLDANAEALLTKLVDALTSVRPNTVQKNASAEATRSTPVQDEEWTEEEIREVLDQEAAEDAEAAPAPRKEGQKATAKVTVEDVRALAADVKMKKGSATEIKSLLSEYGAKSVSTIPADKLDSFATRLKELL